jgi:hypothetical protein
VNAPDPAEPAEQLAAIVDGQPLAVDDGGRDASDALQWNIIRTEITTFPDFIRAVVLGDAISDFDPELFVQTERLWRVAARFGVTLDQFVAMYEGASDEGNEGDKSAMMAAGFAAGMAAGMTQSQVNGLFTYKYDDNGDRLT